jgi:hypothetical protein
MPGWPIVFTAQVKEVVTRDWLRGRLGVLFSAVPELRLTRVQLIGRLRHRGWPLM